MQGIGQAAASMNPMMQNKQKQGGIGPSMGAMGSMMGNKMGQMPGRRMGQMQRPQPQMGGQLGQMAGAMGRQMAGGLGNKGFGRMKQGYQPRQDMGQQLPTSGMSSAVLPGYGNQQYEQQQGPLQGPPMNEGMQQLYGTSEPMQQQPPPQMDPMQQALAAYGPKSSLRRNPGIGPSY
jgi:hypothetical protein